MLENLMLSAEGFDDVFVQVWKIFNKQQLESFAMILWSLWKRKNMILWHATRKTNAAVIARSDEVLRAWQLARKIEGHVTTPLDATLVKWTPPSPSYFKCNLDAAIFQQQCSIGIGLCVRDANGQFFMARTDWRKAQMSVYKVEARGLLEAIKWVIATGLHNVIFEMNGKQVVNDVHDAKSNRSEYGSNLVECRNLLSSNNNFQVVFTMRQANGSAHTLARASISYTNRSDFHYIPGCIIGIICNEMS